MSDHLGSGKNRKLGWVVRPVLLLVVALLAFMGAYFWTSYRGEQGVISIEEKMLSSHNDFFGIHRGTGGHCWIVGKYGLILHTNDGGRKWEKQASGTGQALLGVSFADDRVGFVVGGGGVILSTHPFVDGDSTEVWG